ncbi:MAG: ATP-binding cassette domain-containing protein [Hungatella sp.]|jgi:ABC-2 type transport system ATP-binding protein|nr:ATP-binding cassette domain-containing protein [Hungatella sp.]
MSNRESVNVKNLTKIYGGREVISRFHMSVKQESIYGFLGMNGAGKTTVFKLITGLIKPLSGEIEILGMNLAENRDEILRNVGSLIDTPIFYEHLSARENLKIHLAYMGLLYSDREIEDTLDEVGLRDIGNQPVSQFSFGMRQRLGIARAMIHKPRLLILDEPVNGLDPMGIRQMRSLFLNLVKNRGMTIILSSHILSEIEHIADMIGVIAGGSLIEEVSLQSIAKRFPDGLEDYFFKIMTGGKEYGRSY